jgi:hypothetical protein
MLVKVSFGQSRFCAAATVWLLAAVLFVAAAGILAAEDSPAPPAGPSAVQQPPEKPAPAAAAAPAPASKPGFLSALHDWWNNSIAGFSAKVQDARSNLDNLNKKSTDAVKDAAAATQQAMKSTAEASKDAAAALLRLPNTRLIETRERCANAPNGAPDCQAAATNACRGKGFGTGQPLDVRTTEKCPAAVLLSGQKPGETDCPVESVVTRAVCQ